MKGKKISMPVSRGRARRILGVMLAAALAVASAPVAAHADDTKSGDGLHVDPGLGSGQMYILDGDPIDEIATTQSLNCIVHRRGDSLPSFYAWDACGTFAVVDDVLYRPGNVMGGTQSIDSAHGYWLRSQDVWGTGTADDPATIRTVVDAEDSGVELTQLDSYVDGEDHVTTSISATNTSGRSVDLVLYRAGDCLAGSAHHESGISGYGWAACTAEDSNRVVQWSDMSGGATAYVGARTDVWDAVGSHKPFPNGAGDDSTGDGGMGISWQFNLPAGKTVMTESRLALLEKDAFADSDGDMLPDSWETNGADIDGDGRVDIPLNEMGASPSKPDIFVEADWMVSPVGGSYQLSNDMVENLEQRFSSHGIALHIDGGPDTLMDYSSGKYWGALSSANEVPYTAVLGSFGSGGSSGYDWGAFDSYRKVHFPSARESVFRYAIMADRYGTRENNSSGISRPYHNSQQAENDDAYFEFGGQDFLVAEGTFTSVSLSGTKKKLLISRTFMHELGHTLGLGHGGNQGMENYKPNYLSIMNYSFQFSGIPENRAGKSSNIPTGYDTDFSDIQLPDLDERSLTESDGIDPAGLTTTASSDSGTYLRIRQKDARSSVCEKTMILPAARAGLDYNSDGVIGSEKLAADANCSADGSVLSVLTGFDDWSHLVFKGGSIGAMGAKVTGPRFTQDDEYQIDDAIRNGDLGHPGEYGIYMPYKGDVVIAGSGQRYVYVTVRDISGEDTNVSVTVTGDWVRSGSYTTEFFLPGSVDYPNDGAQRIAVPIDAPGAPGSSTIHVATSMVCGHGEETCYGADPGSAEDFTLTAIDPASQEGRDLNDFLLAQRSNLGQWESSPYDQTTTGMVFEQLIAAMGGQARSYPDVAYDPVRDLDSSDSPGPTGPSDSPSSSGPESNQRSQTPSSADSGPAADSSSAGSGHSDAAPGESMAQSGVRAWPFVTVGAVALLAACVITLVVRRRKRGVADGASAEDGDAGDAGRGLSKHWWGRLFHRG
ncbi:hypothetical protein ACLUWO_06720 [Pseudoscardovia radai]|uniref:hypothetical protein n=1 Tax=Pseudoscardovia radai TaxID=987066 RepID=UPI003995015D